MQKRRVFTNAKITTNVSMVLSEEEARALNMLTAYGIKNLLDSYRKYLGSAMNGYEQGLESLFEACQLELPLFLKQIDEARTMLGVVKS